MNFSQALEELKQKGLKSINFEQNILNYSDFKLIGVISLWKKWNQIYFITSTFNKKSLSFLQKINFKWDLFINNDTIEKYETFFNFIEKTFKGKDLTKFWFCKENNKDIIILDQDYSVSYEDLYKNFNIQIEQEHFRLKQKENVSNFQISLKDIVSKFIEIIKTNQENDVKFESILNHHLFNSPFLSKLEVDSIIGQKFSWTDEEIKLIQTEINLNTKKWVTFKNIKFIYNTEKSIYLLLNLKQRDSDTYYIVPFSISFHWNKSSNFIENISFHSLADYFNLEELSYPWKYIQKINKLWFFLDLSWEQHFSYFDNGKFSIADNEINKTVEDTKFWYKYFLSFKGFYWKKTQVSNFLNLTIIENETGETYSITTEIESLKDIINIDNFILKSGYNKFNFEDIYNFLLIFSLNKKDLKKINSVKFSFKIKDKTFTIIKAQDNVEIVLSNYNKKAHSFILSNLTTETDFVNIFFTLYKENL